MDIKEKNNLIQTALFVYMRDYQKELNREEVAVIYEAIKSDIFQNTEEKITDIKLGRFKHE